MDIEKIEVGSCYIYTTDKNKTFGFVLLKKESTAKKTSSVEFAIVYLNDKIISLEEFKKGKLYTHNVYEGLNGDYKMGIQCIDFYAKDFYFLDKFKYIGSISVNKDKFTFGGGNSFTSEFLFNLTFNIMDQSMSSANYKKESLVTILN